MANWEVGTGSPHFGTLALAYASGSVSSGDTLELYNEAHDGTAALSSSKNIILVPYSTKHDGKDWSSGARIVWTNDSHIWASTHTGNITARDLIVLSAVDDSQGWDASNEVIRTGNNITCLWERCMLGPTKDDGTESAYSQVDSDSTHTFRNCLIKGFARSAASSNAGGLLQGNSQACTWTLEHCTIDLKGGLRNAQNRQDTITIRGCVIKCGDNTGVNNQSAAGTFDVYDTITNFAKPANVDTDTNNDWDPNSPGSPGSLFTVTTTATTDVIISALPSTYPDGEYDLVAPTGSGVNLALDNATIGVVEDDLVDTARTDGSNDDSGCFELVDSGITGAAAMTMPALSMSGSGDHGQSGSAVMSLPPNTMSGSGWMVPSGSAAMALPASTMAGTGAQTFSGAAAMALPASAIAGAGSQTIAGSAASTLPVATITGSGFMQPSGSASMTLPVIVLTGAGATAGAVGSGSVVLPVLSISGAGGQTFTGSGALALPALAMSGVGFMQPSGPVAMQLPVIVMAGAGITGGATGSGAMALPVSVIAAAGGQTFSGSGSMVLPASVISGSGFMGVSGAAASTLPVVVMAAAGAQQPAGAAALTLPAIAIVGSGALYGTGGPYQQLSDRVRAYFIAQVQTPLALDVAFDNQEHAVSSGLWARMRLEHASTEQIAWGQENVYRQSGQIRFEVRSPAMGGEAAGRQAADTFVAGLRGMIWNGVTYGSAGRVGAGRREGPWWVQEYVCPFHSDFAEAPLGGSAKLVAVTRANLWITIADRFAELVEVAEGVPVLYDDFPFAGPQNQTWVRLTIADGQGSIVDSGSTYRTPGIATAQVFAKALTGTQEQVQIIDTIATSFRAVSVKGVTFATPSVQTVGETGTKGRRHSWWQANVVCPFFFHETVST